MEKIKTTMMKVEKLWEKVPELSLGHLISLAVKNEDNLYQMPDDELVRNIGSFVAAMENQKNIRRG
jgi:hypothetical protein